MTLGSVSLTPFDINKPQVDFQKAHTTRGTVYPHEFFTNNPNWSPDVLSELNREPGCQLGQPGTTYLEYPMSDNENVAPYTGDTPGGDRIIMMVRGTSVGQYSNPVYCLSITHQSKISPHMIPCPDDMSPRAQTTSGST